MVRVGQVYEEKDRRIVPGRRVEVVEIKGSNAVCRNVKTGKRTVIKIARLSTPYRFALVNGEAPPATET